MAAQYSLRWITMWWYGMSWYMGNKLSSPLRYFTIRSRKSLVWAMLIDLPEAILVAAIRSQKLTNSLFSWQPAGWQPHRWPKVMMRCTVQKTHHASAEIFPWPLSPICGGAGEHQEGSVVLSISSQIAYSLEQPRTRVLVRLEFTCFALAKHPGSGFRSVWESSVIPSLCLY